MHQLLHMGDEVHRAPLGRQYCLQYDPSRGAHVCTSSEQGVADVPTSTAVGHLHWLRAAVLWCEQAVTGTPLSRGLEDLQGLMVFLRAEPWCDRAAWIRAIQNPCTMGHPAGGGPVQESEPMFVFCVCFFPFVSCLKKNETFQHGVSAWVLCQTRWLHEMLMTALSRVVSGTIRICVKRQLQAQLESVQARKTSPHVNSQPPTPLSTDPLQSWRFLSFIYISIHLDVQSL